MRSRYLKYGYRVLTTCATLLPSCAVQQVFVSATVFLQRHARPQGRGISDLLEPGISLQYEVRGNNTGITQAVRCTQRKRVGLIKPPREPSTTNGAMSTCLSCRRLYAAPPTPPSTQHIMALCGKLPQRCHR